MKTKSPESRLPAACRRAGALAALALGTALAGCSEPTKPAVHADVNPDLPSANARILSEQAYGDGVHKSTIWQLEPAGGSSSFLRGLVDDRPGFGLVGASGGPAWFTPTAYGPLDVEPLPIVSPLAGAVVALGDLDVSGDGKIDTGYAKLVNAAGTQVNQVLIARDSARVTMGRLQALSDSEFVAVGTVLAAGQDYPLLAMLVVTAADTLALREQYVFTSLPGVLGCDVAVDGTEPPGPVRRIYLSIGTQGATSGITVSGVDLDMHSLAGSTVAWTRTVAPDGQGSDEYDMRAFGGAVYVVGNVADEAKGKGGDGVTWESGFIARIARDGTLSWSRTVSATKHQEGLYGVRPLGANVVACGIAAAYQTGDKKSLYGYGWIVKLSPATGDVLASLTFGDRAYSSYFGGLSADGGTVWAGGNTRASVPNGGRQAWRCRLDVATTDATPSAVAPALRRPDDRPVRLVEPRRAALRARGF